MESVAVVGAGIMGSGIAQLAAMAGHEVVLVDVGEPALALGMERVDASLERFTRKGRFTPEAADAVRGRLRTTVDMVAAAASAEIIVEAVPEVFELKREVWATLSDAASETALLATNTSQISITRLASTIPEAAPRFVGAHFFNPPVMMRLVELVRGLETGSRTVDRAREFAEGLGQEVVVCAKDSPGFITTRAYAAMRMECLRMLEEGIGTAADIDKALKLAFNFPMGPFELADFNGLDTLVAAMDGLQAHFGERFRPTTELRNIVAAGRIGRKSGRGFFEYPAGEHK